MKRNTKIVMLIWIGIIALIHISYLVIVRQFISTDSLIADYSKVFVLHHGITPETYNFLSTPRNIADHFIHSFCISQYFLFVHLWFGYTCYYEYIADRNQNRIKYLMKLEWFALWGMILPYIILWIGNSSDVFLFPVQKPIMVIYILLTKKSYLYAEELWRKRYWDYLTLIVILAPIILPFLIYSINFIIRYIKYRVNHCLDKKWKWWNIAYILFVFILISWTFDAMHYYKKIPRLPIYDRIFWPIYDMFS